MTDGSGTVSEPGTGQDVTGAAESVVEKNETAAGAGTDAVDEKSANLMAGTDDEKAPGPVPDTDVVAPADSAVDAATAAADDRPAGLEAKAAEQLHGLIERGADLIPGEQGGMVSRFAVALLSFGSAMTERGEKQTSALATDAVQLFKSLDGEPEKQRAAMETAISNLGSNLFGGEERGKVVDVAQQAMGLWKSSGGGIAGAAGAAASLAKSDSALSLRSLAGLLRGNGDDDGAEKSEEEARKLEEK